MTWRQRDKRSTDSLCALHWCRYLTVSKGPTSTLYSLTYIFALYCLSPMIFVYTLVQAVRARDRRYLRGRYGFGHFERTPAPIWIHAASVGEVLAAEPLVRSLKTRCSNQSIVVTTGTPTGGKVARLRLPPGVTQLYAPIDFPGAVNRFLTALAPSCALIMETELWPTLYAACASRNIPLIVVNARLSPRTLSARAWLRRIYKRALGCVDAILARSANDRDGFVALGAPPERVKVIGNIKFAADPESAQAVPAPLVSRPYVLAASTHDDEERRFVKLWRSHERHGRLLVIAPRHPLRLKGILKQLEPFDLRIAVRSRNDAIDEHTDLYIVDTLGELNGFMANAQVVFIGGSLIARGGHNILEPARLGRPIVFGPHMENFADEARIFVESEAAIQVTDDDALGKALTGLLDSPRQRDELGRRARSVIDRYQDIAERYVDEIAAHCRLARI